MSISRTIKSALEPLAPIEADTYEGNKAVYLTFNYSTIPANFGDDKPEHERVLIQVHLFAPVGHNTVTMRRDIKTRLHAAGMTWPSYTNASDKDGQHHVFECEAAQEAGAE